MHTPVTRPALQPQGFTLIEILVVIGMLAILTTVVIVAVNPARQFAQAQNSQREANVATVLNAIGNRIADTRGNFTDPSDPSCEALPDEHALISNSASSGPIADLRPCLVPDYLPELPTDPEYGMNDCLDAECQSATYNTEYRVKSDPASGRVSVCSMRYKDLSTGEQGMYCLTR